MSRSVEGGKYLAEKSKHERCFPRISTGNFVSGSGGTKTNNFGSACRFWFTVALVPILILPVNSERVRIWKCCYKGENLHSNGRDCVSRPGHKVDPISNALPESVLEIAKRNPEELYWLPPSLKDRDISVMYTSVFVCNKFLILSANDTSRVTFEEDMNVTVHSVNGSSETVFETDEYCMDASDGPISPWAVRFCNSRRFTQVDKCCPQNQVIVQDNGRAKCAENKNVSAKGAEWLRQAKGNPMFAYNSYSKCTKGRFGIFDQPNLPLEFVDWFLQGKPLEDKGEFWKYMCIDARAVEEAGGPEWGLGYCAFQIIDYNALSATKYLGVAAAVLLGAAVGATLAQKRTRDSTHGRALACHAASLFFAQVASAAFNFGGEQHCHEIALAINFFMLAAAFWLQIICFNMARGFNQMLRVSKRAGRKSSGIKTFCFYSLYGWGCPTIATIVIVSTFSDDRLSYPLYHTKTCFYEEGHQSWTTKTSTLLFYYAPVCIILLLNIGMFVFIALKIRMMQKGTEILNRKGDGQPSGTRKSAVLYAKVVLVMGVAEAAGDVAAWAWKDSSVRGPQGERLTDKALVVMEFLRREFSYRWAVYALELLRAASICALCCPRPLPRPLLRPLRRLRALCAAPCIAPCAARGAKGKEVAPTKSGDADGEGRSGDGKSGDGADGVETVHNECGDGEERGSAADEGDRRIAEREAESNNQLTSLRRIVHVWMGRLLNRSEQPPPTDSQQRASVGTVITVMDDSSRKFSAS